MADKTIKFILDAENKANGAIDEVRSKLELTADTVEKKLSPAFKKMAEIGTASFLVLAGGIGLAVKEYMNAEAAQNRLTQILKTSRGATDEQVNALLKQADALEKVGVVSKDSIVQAQAQLATFDLETESIARLIPSILDYVVAEKGAGASTDDLKSLTNGLAQALQGNFASLTKTGFVLDDATKELIKNGTETERTTALVKVLDSTYKGFNASARETAEGALIVLKNNFNNLRQEIGGAFIPVLVSVVEKISPVIEKITEWVEKNPQLTQNILLAGLAISGLVAAVGFLGMALPAIITGFSLLMGPVGLVILALGAVAFAVSKLGIDWGAVLEYLKQINVIDAARSAWDLLGQSLQWFIQVIKDTWAILNQLYDYFTANILPVLMALWQTMLVFVQPIFERLWQTISTKLWPALTQLWNTLVTQLFPALLQLWTAIQPLVIVLGAALYGALILVVGVLGILIDTLAMVLSWITQLADFIIKVATAAINNFTDTINNLVNAFKAIVEWGQKAAQYIGGGISGAVTKVTNFVTGKASGGPVSAGTPYIVGEQGPELFIPGVGGGRIVPNGAGGASIVLNISGPFYGEDGIADRIGKELMRIIKQNVKL